MKTLTNKILLFTKKDCPHCRTHGHRVKKLFDTEKIEYEIFDCDTENGLVESAMLNILSLPCLLIGESRFFGELPSNSHIIDLCK